DGKAVKARISGGHRRPLAARHERLDIGGRDYVAADLIRARYNRHRGRKRPRWKPAATEVRCGIELSPCSAACPSGTIYTSFLPDICAGLLGGSSAAPRTSAAPLSVGLPFEFGFADQTTPLPG
ncbi:hypothetical protein THAOC_32468, partial [Thalassiosira oceanica]